MSGAIGADAQPAKTVPRLGVLYPGASDPAPVTPFIDAFTQGLRELGYVEGQNVAIERRFGGANSERIAEMAAELVRLKVDVLVTSTDVGVAGVRKQTQTIPIVMVSSTDPVATGFVASLARPGGNVTGMTNITPELSAKRLELLKEAVPGLFRVAVLWNPDARGAVFDYKETDNAARTLGLQLQSVEVSRAEDLERAFASVAAGRPDALVVVPSAFALVHRAKIASLAIRSRLPSVYGQRLYTEAGGLMSYGADPVAAWRRSATYVDKILKGAKPSELPIEQPSAFDLSINLKTARTLGLTIPPALLRRADSVFQ